MNGTNRKSGAQLALLLASISICASCSTNSSIIGFRAKLPKTPAAEQRTIILKTYFEFNPSHVSPRYRLPAGEYRATAEDEHGIYFAAPEKLIQKRIVGIFEYEGGLYWAKGRHPRLKFYCSMDPGGGGPWDVFDLPPEFSEAEGRTFFVEPPLTR
jgi:hypothetical protein